MKKKIIALLLCGTIFISGCSSQKSLKTEYDIDEFLEIWEDIGELVDEDTEYVPEDELLQARYESITKHLKSTDLTPGQIITINGKIEPLVAYDGKFLFSLVESDYEYDEENSWNLVSCSSEDTWGILINPMENVTITGTLLAEEGSTVLSHCTIDSPSLSKLEYEANLSTISDDDSLFMGEVSAVYRGYDKMKQFITYHNIDYNSSLSSSIEYANEILLLTDGKITLPCSISLDTAGDIKEGDKIAIRGYWWDNYISDSGGFYIF